MYAFESEWVRRGWYDAMVCLVLGYESPGLLGQSAENCLTLSHQTRSALFLLGTSHLV